MSDDIGSEMPRAGGDRRVSTDAILPEGPREKPRNILRTVSRKVSLEWEGQDCTPLDSYLTCMALLNVQPFFLPPFHIYLSNVFAGPGNRRGGGKMGIRYPLS